MGRKGDKEGKKKYFTVSYTPCMAFISNDLFNKFHGLFFFFKGESEGKNNCFLASKFKSIIGCEYRRALVIQANTFLD